MFPSMHGGLATIESSQAAAGNESCSHSPQFVKEPPARRLSWACLRCCQMSTLIATDSGPGSRLGPCMQGNAPFFRSLEFSTNLRHSWHCPGLTAQSRSPLEGDRGYHAPIRTPASLGRGQPKLLEQPPAGGLPSALRLHGSRMSTYPASRRGSNGMHGGGEPQRRSCQRRHQPRVVPVSGQ